MTLLGDLESDFLTVDNLEEFTLDVLNEAGTVVDTVVIDYGLKMRTKEAIVVNDRLVDSDQTCVWHALVSAFGVIEPKKGDKLTRAKNGEVWLVWTADKVTMDIRYRITCIKE